MKQYFNVRGKANITEAIRRKNQPPCKNCEERHEACHSSCEKFSTWKESFNKDMSDFCKKFAKENRGGAEDKRRFLSKQAYKKSVNGQGSAYDDRVRWHTRKSS